MGKRKKKRVIWALVVALMPLLALTIGVAYELLSPLKGVQKTVYVYIDRDDNIDSICHKIAIAGHLRSMWGFRKLSDLRHYGQHIHTGRYPLHPTDNVYQCFLRFYRGQQTPINLTIGSVRTTDRIAQQVGNRLMIDSAEVAALMNDTTVWQRMGYRKETLACLFIPNTYQVYWDMSAEEFMKRMKKEHDRFWNKERLQKAESIGLTPDEVATLASIVEEETNNKAEQPMVAGLYINRLQRGMPLQADPTVKFALQDFGLRRILNKHLEVESPYNTYLHAGLPPGPIRIASPSGLDAVLNYTRHNYLYMCAKEDFSGTHNFATTLREHTANAQRYWRALNRRGIRL